MARLFKYVLFWPGGFTKMTMRNLSRKTFGLGLKGDLFCNGNSTKIETIGRMVSSYSQPLKFFKYNLGKHMLGNLCRNSQSA